ncbi:MAG: TetR family transcriptional regulator [Gammaproteobacteria bacterium]|nr:TetR family transcriptional regulator [Gammaproteobacteria bacterium]
MSGKTERKRSYHHGNLAASLLDAVDELASQFGLEAVTLRGCAKLAGVSPSSAFRHYADKRALITAFAARALSKLADLMLSSAERAHLEGSNPFLAVGLAYIEFALDKPAFFRAMWYEEGIYSNDPVYIEAADKLRNHLRSGFANTLPDDDSAAFSSQELLAWSAVHGLASLLIDGPVARQQEKAEKMQMAADMLKVMKPAIS